ncbi:MAG: hypothetical protein HC850_07270 [Rhodomicrobium sp.]|nr:hypothetical protein [Rhodomicrobium sp.]
MPARERLENALEALFGSAPTPVPSLYSKLAGRQDTTVRDAARIVAALISSWPEPIKLGSTARAGRAADVSESAKSVAEGFVRELLSSLSDGRSWKWSTAEMAARVFRLVDEERIGVAQFIREAGEKGALIVAGFRNILIGPDPISTIREFHRVTSGFIAENNNGLLIFVFDMAIFEAGEHGFNIVYNLGLLSSAIIGFALFDDDYKIDQPIIQRKVDWSRWRMLAKRCCVVIRKPPLIDPASGALIKRDRLDEFIASWRPRQEFAHLAELKGFIRFDSGHVLPRRYPDEISEDDTLKGRDLYWDVVIEPKGNQPLGLGVNYFTPATRSSGEEASPASKERTAAEVKEKSSRGRPSAKLKPIEEDLFYVVKRKSPGLHYDDAQRAIYMAVRARLNLDTGRRQLENLNAASALRQVGYEVLPISVMLSLFPRALHFAAAANESHNGGGKR